jgi:hypothetical protein
MRPEAFEYVDVTSGPEGLPLRSTQGSDKAASLMHLVFVSALAALVVIPQLGLAAYALATPSIRQSVLDQPMVAFQLAVAMAFWIALFAWPLRGLIARLTSSRSVEITSERVLVSETGTFGASNWTAPLASYTGITHRVRSSLSGTRHELILAHPLAEHSVLLLTAPHISDSEITRMSQLLRLPQIQAAEIYDTRAASRATPKTQYLQPLAA